MREYGDHDNMGGLFVLIIIIGIFCIVGYLMVFVYAPTFTIESKEITVFAKVHGARAIDNDGVIIDTNRNKYITTDENIYTTLNEGRNYNVTIWNYSDGRMKIADVKW